MLLPYLFNIIQGDKKLTKSEISDETYITLKTPVYIGVMIFIVGCAISIYGVYNQVNNNSDLIENKVSVVEYRHDRKIDSIADSQYRRDARHDFEAIIENLEILTKRKIKGSSYYNRDDKE